MKAKLVILAVLMCTLWICAGDTLASGRKGSLTVMLPVSGGEVTLYDAGQISAERLTPEYAKLLEAELSGAGCISSKVSKDGRVLFEDLEPGTYLVSQRVAAAGYQKIHPFFVTIPMRQNGEWIYDVSACPKTEPLPEDPENPDTGERSIPLYFLVCSTAGMALLLLARDGNGRHVNGPF